MLQKWYRFSGKTRNCWELLSWDFLTGHMPFWCLADSMKPWMLQLMRKLKSRMKFSNWNQQCSGAVMWPCNLSRTSDLSPASYQWETAVLSADVLSASISWQCDVERMLHAGKRKLRLFHDIQHRVDCRSQNSWEHEGFPHFNVLSVA